MGNSPQDLYRIGVLDSSTSIVLSHATYLDSRGAALLRKTNNYISITPESESKLILEESGIFEREPMGLPCPFRPRALHEDFNS